MNRQMMITATSIALLAGTAVPVATASAQSSSTVYRVTDHSTTTLGFYKTSTLLGTEIVNANGEPVGSVGDLIIDRGSGRVEYVVLSDGGFFGVGGREVAIPFATFGFDHAEGRLRLDVTPELIDQASEFEAKDWMELDSSTWQEQLDETYTAALEAVGRTVRDPFADGINDAEAIDVTGTITSVDRMRTINGVEQVSVTLRTDDRRSHTVVLGPSWYVMGQAGAPMRGDEVKITGYKLKRDGQKRVVAREATVDGEQLRLRGRNGEPRWDVTWSERRSEAENRNSPATPFLMVSDLIGMDAHARDEDGGEIADAVIEVESGKLAMLSLDPNEGFLGLGDTLRCVPFSIAAIGSDVVRIDADKDMLTNCEAMPEDVSVFVSETRVEPVYSVFQVDVVEFEPRERRDWGAQTHLGGWSTDGKFSEAIRDGRDVTIKGTVRGMTTVAAVENGPEAKAIRIKTESGTRTVVLGPKWFVDRQDLRIDEGDTLAIEAKRVSHNGREHLVACVVTEGDRKVSLWKNDTPVWDAS